MSCCAPNTAPTPRPSSSPASLTTCTTPPCPTPGSPAKCCSAPHLIPVLRRLTDQALATLPAGLAAHTRDALALAADAGTPEGRAFNAADVIDRIMEVRHFAAVAGFTEAQATDDMELVHAGPLQDFHYQVMRRAGLLSA